MKLAGPTTLLAVAAQVLCSQTIARRSASRYGRRCRSSVLIDAEDCGVGTDANRERHDGDKAEARRPQQQPRPVAKVLKH